MNSTSSCPLAKVRPAGRWGAGGAAGLIDGPGQTSIVSARTARTRRDGADIGEPPWGRRGCGRRCRAVRLGRSPTVAGPVGSVDALSQLDDAGESRNLHWLDLLQDGKSVDFLSSLTFNDV